MKRLVVAVLAIAVLTMAAVPVAAATSGATEILTQMQADAKRVDKLRHGYIKYDGNRMYYYW